MDLKLLATVFATVFVAELGDKTQLATLLFAAGRQDQAWTVFVAAAAALVLSAALGVLAGSWLGTWLNPRWLGIIAGSGFIAIGAWTLVSALGQSA